MNLGGSAGRARRFAQESAFALVALDAMNDGAGDAGQQNRDDEAGKPGARTHVHPSQGARSEAENLGAVGDVPGPDRGEGGLGDEIGRLSPPRQMVHEDDKAFLCFT